MVQPSVPWPVLSHRFLYAVRPTTGVPSGVIGRRPVQNVACSTWPPRGNRIAHHHLQGFATRLQQRFVKTDDLRHAADPNALNRSG
ncbi:Uncharacterised protein [Klebsiella pneumoniae]|uniref:Uncharacterized protein n=1 Tax=Klebsiella pneumoniae TaxID=573 RepID=A0A377TXG9_KLEPN|nr:Uncharacterised protein [Klebsiella pneumoniae]